MSKAKKPKLAHKLVSLFASIALVVGLTPIVPGVATAWASSIDQPSDRTGTVYVSYSHDGEFAEGTYTSGYMSYVPVKIEDLVDIMNDDECFYDPNEDGVNDVVVYWLFKYALTNYDKFGAGDWDVSNIGSGSAFMNAGTWHLKDGTPWTYNLNYYVDGAYPLADVGWGATLDQITLHDGDFVDVMHFSSDSFWMDEDAGFQYFVGDKFLADYAAGDVKSADIDYTPDYVVHEFTATAGQPLTVSVVRAYGDLMSGGGTAYSIYNKSKIFYGSSLYADDAVSVNQGETSTQITFAQPGTYWMWTDGQAGTSDDIVNSPAVAKVTVEPAPAVAKTATVDFTSQMSGGFLHAPQFGYEVESDLAESYGYTDNVASSEAVSALDVAVAAHELVFGDAFTPDTATDFLEMSGSYMTVFFGIDASDYSGGFFLNHTFANDGTESDYGGYNGTTIDTQPVIDGDLVEFFFYEDESYGDTYNWFVDEDGAYARTFEAAPGEDLELTLEGVWAMYGYLFKDLDEMIASDMVSEQGDVQIYTVDLASGELTPIAGAITDEDEGTVTLKFDDPGTYTITAFGTEDAMWTQILSLTTINVEAPAATEPGFTVKVNGEAIADADITVVADGYNAGYTDWQTGEWVESLVPLYTVNLPEGVKAGDKVEITLNNYKPAYQCYVYDVELGENGYISMGFGDETEIGGMSSVVASANKAYEAEVLPKGQVYRFQTVYDPATWASDNLYAISLKVYEKPALLTSLIAHLTTGQPTDANVLIHTEGDGLTEGVVFDPNTFEYTVKALPDSSNQVRFRPVVADEGSKAVLYYGENFSQSKDITWTPGSSASTWVNFLSQGAGTVQAKLVVEPAEGSDLAETTYLLNFPLTPQITALSATSEGSPLYLDKTFNANTYEYTVNVPSTAQTIDLNVTPRRAAYTLTYNGAESSTVDISAADKVDIVVTGGEGAGATTNTYTVNLVKVPAATATFTVTPADAGVIVYDGHGAKIAPKADGSYSGMFSAEEYTYTVAAKGYKSASGTIPAEGGAITVALEQVTDEQPAAVDADWYNFRNSETNMGVTDALTPTDPDATMLKFAKKLGTGWAAAPSTQLIVDGALIVTSGTTIYKLDLQTGDILSQGTMSASVNYGYTPMTYAEGMIFVPISGGIQAFNAATLESLWVYKDKLGGQALSQIVYSDGYLYTGYWNSEVKDANYACVSITDEDAANPTENKVATWTYASAGGFYWAGGIVRGDYVVVGSDDGDNGYQATSTLRAFNKKTGEVVSSISLEGFGDQRSSIAYYETNGRLYFTSKNGHVASVAFDATTGQISDLKSYATGAQCTGTPIVYDGVVYVGTGAGFENPGNFLALDADTMELLYAKPLRGYPQASLLLSTAYADSADSGYLAFYSTYNTTPGGIQLVKVPVGNKTGEGVEVVDVYDAEGYSQYCICSPIAGADGTIYYKNDSGNVLAVAVKPGPADLTITNTTNMFKAVSASVETGKDGSKTLVMALSGSGYEWLYLGTYEDAVAANEQIAAGIAAGQGSDKLIPSTTNADGKLEFRIPISKDGGYMPIVAISKSYYNKYLNGENPLERAYYPRQAEVDLEAATLVTGDYENVTPVTVTNNVSMFKVDSAAIHTIGGPNSNNYSVTLDVTMGSTSFDKVALCKERKVDEDTTIYEITDKVVSLPVDEFTDGERITTSWWSVKNEKWYERDMTFDAQAKTLVFDETIKAVDVIDAYDDVNALKAAIADGTLVVTPELVDDMIAAIYVQYRDENTDYYCEATKALWDALTDEQKEQVEEGDYYAADTGDASADDPLNQDGIGENEILVVSFGTSFNDSRVATIGGVEKAIAEAYPDWSVRRAFTAQIIINHIQSRDGEVIDNVEQAMDRAVANGVKNLIVQPTHLMHGAEYDELKAVIDKYADKIRITYAEPLLGEVGADETAINNDKMTVARAVVDAACEDAGYDNPMAAAADGTAIVLMGHGTAHVANITYKQMQTAMAALGYDNVFVGTVEGEPEGTACDEVIDKVAEAGYTKVILRPLMVVAGDHANNDMADQEDEESWYSQFVASEKFTDVTCQIKGLGEIDVVQQLYVRHIANVMTEASIRTDGTKYRIVSASDNDFILDVAEVMPTIGANVSIWPSNGGENQLFTFEMTDNGDYVIRNVANPELVLDAAGAVPEVGANVSTWSYNGGKNQEWDIVSARNGYFILVNVGNPTLWLDAAGAEPEIGANVGLWYGNGGLNQMWKFVEANDLAYADITVSGMERNATGAALSPEIAVNMNGKDLVAGTDYVVTYGGSETAPSAVGAYDVVIKGMGDYSGTVELGTFHIYLAPVPAGGTNKYHIVSGFSDDFVLDVAEVMPTIGANVSIWVDNEGSNQMFTLELGADGYYVLRNVANPELVLDAAGAEPVVGANVSTWSLNGGMNQKWVLIPIDEMGGYFLIASASDTGFVLDAAGAEPEIGANVSIWYANGGLNQAWKLDRVPAKLQDGTYKATGLSTAVLSMYHFHDAKVVIKGDDAWLLTTEDTDNTVKRFDGMAYGPQSVILDPSDTTNHTLVEGTATAVVVPTYKEDGTTLLTRTFVLPVPKSVFAFGDDIYYMIKYVSGYSATHDGDWYKASGGDYYLTGYTLEFESDSTELPAPASVDLTITNNTGMFKAVTASADQAGDGSAVLTFALSGSGYHYLYKGTYEEAVANGAATENWIAGYQNDAGKWEFQMEIAADELGKDVPVVAVSQSYYEKYLNGQNPIARAFFPRQLNLNLSDNTLVTGDFEASQALEVSKEQGLMMSVSSASLDTIGGPNSNGYKKVLSLVMGSGAYTKAFVGTPAEAEEAAEADIAQLGEDNTFDLTMLWMKTAGDPSSTISLWEDGEPFVASFWSKKNEQWYGRALTLDEAAGTLYLASWVDPTTVDVIDTLGTIEAVQAALADGSLVATPELAANLIDAIYVQQRDEKTDLYCASAKMVWDALTDEQKEQVEGDDADPDYFGRDTGDASADDPLNADNIGEKEILVVSFGTSFNDSRVATIGGIEKALAAAYPDWSVRRAFTAQIIINHIQARDGEKIDNVEQAMERAVANNVKTLVVQPTHLMHGAEYDELKEAIDKYADKMTITYAEPLLGQVGADATVVNADKEAVAKAVVAAACKDADFADAAEAAANKTAIVLMGHGTAHNAKVTYEQMQTQMDQLGYTNVFIGTVEGEPESTACEAIIAKVKAAGYERVILRPLMVVAGDHANNDMADPDDEESWYSQFTAEGNFAADNVTCQIAGLGQIPAVQQIYVAHTAAVIG